MAAVPSEAIPPSNPRNQVGSSNRPGWAPKVGAQPIDRPERKKPNLNAMSQTTTPSYAKSIHGMPVAAADSFPIRSRGETNPAPTPRGDLQPGNSDSFPIRFRGETNPTPAPRRGGQPGNTNALRHGSYSERFNALKLQSILEQPQSDDAQLSAPSPHLARHLQILRAVIEDLAQSAAQGNGPAVPLLIQAIRSHATITSLAISIPSPDSRRLNNPEGHAKCANCQTWWQNRFLSAQGLCRKCAAC